jgi:hypothetical protein
LVALTVVVQKKSHAELWLGAELLWDWVSSTKKGSTKSLSISGSSAELAAVSPQ